MHLSKPIIRAILAAVLCCGAPFAAHAQSDPEMMRKFAEFVRWPDALAPQQTMQVRVCIYGEMPMQEFSAIFSKTSASNPIKFMLSAVGQPGDAAGCHMLFIAASRASQVDAALSALAGKPVLTVSDAPGFAEKGGMIGFNIINGKVRYDINNTVFAPSQLKVDAQLLEIANKVVE